MGKSYKCPIFFELKPPETARNLEKSTAMSSLECPLFKLIRN